MFRKYQEVWQEHVARYGPRTALLYQVGGFFELYDTENLATGKTQTNIREIAELCQLSLSVHAIDGNSQTLFGGFPDHALGKFERTLVHAGFTVVVVVQRKGATGAVEERIVDHISSPGCYVEGAQERRLVGCILESLSDGPVALRRVYWAAATIDVATGSIWFVEGVDRDRLHQFLCMQPPSELIVWSDGLPAAVSWAEALATATSQKQHVRCLAPASAALDEAALEQLWSVARLDWLSTQPQSRRVLAALTTFAREHLPSAMKQLRLPEVWIPDGDVRLGNAALEQLGLISLSDKQCLLSMMDRCRSVAGRRLLRARLLRPITSVPELEARLDRIDRAAATDEEQSVKTERALRSMYDMSRLFRKVELGSANLNDMACLLRSFSAAQSLLQTSLAPSEQVTTMLQFLTQLFTIWNLETLTEIARECKGAPVTALPFVSGAKPEIEAEFAKGLVIRREAEALCREFSALGRGETLHLDDAEGGGFRIVGTKRRVASVLAALLDAGVADAKITAYKTSSSLETARLEALSARHRIWWTSWTSVWSTTWSTICAELVETGGTLSKEIELWCADLDVSWTLAHLAKEWLWTRPVFDTEATESYFDAENLRHPILERLQKKTNYVPHTIRLGPGDRGLLLYGMNASGKSSLMKAIGLSTVLAQCGVPVPASRFKIAPFSAIFTRILGNDNLWAGLSSFAVEMTEFREVLRYADARSLVLGDELCSGTESMSATALVAAGVETLGTRGSKFLFATHLHELASIVKVKSMHLKVHYDATTDTLVYDRCLAPGSGSALYGLEVCRALDLPAEFLERAITIRKSLEGATVPHPSSYSSAAIVELCAVCEGKTLLEMHHIRPQAEGGAAAAEGFDIHSPGNLVCLCRSCHDDHHAGILQILRWSETSRGRKLEWSRKEESKPELCEEIQIWIQEQKKAKVRVATIRRVAKQKFGVDL